jgi:signal transduction histidine kinase
LFLSIYTAFTLPTTWAQGASKEVIRSVILSITGNLRREWKAYFSQRLWIVGVLLLVLCALALMQYHWIDQVAQAERQRLKTNLTTTLSDVEADFDIEITRVSVFFNFPGVSPADYSQRYKEWLSRAPYPKLIQGVYFLDTRKTGALLESVIPREPAIPFPEWKSALPQLVLSQSVATASPPKAAAFVRFPGLSNLDVMVDGNPAFVFPVIPLMPRLPTQPLTSMRRNTSAFGPIEIRGGRGPLAPSQWAVVILDANYLAATFLPRLLKIHLPGGSASSYDILVENKAAPTPSRIVYHSGSAASESEFGHPDGSIRLFALRMDCFLPLSSTANVGIAVTPILRRRNASSPGKGAPVVGSQVHIFTGLDSLSEWLAPIPPNCGNPVPAFRDSSTGSWELLVRSRTGSLDQTMATFRQRSLLLSGSVLLVLALGICMLVVLTERARALAEMQTEFVLGVSHELRTPVTVIQVAADNLKKGLVQNSEQARKYGAIIHTHASELSNMIEETLAYARMQSATLIRHRTLVAPEQIVRDALASNESALRNAGIEVGLDLAPHLPPINADVQLLKKCLDTLIHNAIKYAGAGRWMALRAKKVSKPEGMRVQLSVEDRGPGISSVDLAHIFEPFYRGKHGEASQVPGIGLGLTLVKRVAEAHGGTVEAVSADGAEFSIFLPFSPLQPDAQEAARPVQQRTSAGETR